MLQLPGTFSLNFSARCMNRAQRVKRSTQRVICHMSGSDSMTSGSCNFSGRIVGRCACRSMSSPSRFLSNPDAHFTTGPPSSDFNSASRSIVLLPALKEREYSLCTICRPDRQKAV
jgi:hypothetical protein